MDNVVIGAECIIGALCFVPAEMQIPARKVVVGNPAKIVKDVSDEMITWKTEGTRLYQSLPEQLRKTLKAVEPLREIEPGRPTQQISYKTWRETSSSK
jgi:phenylacetic acid degradation protein